MNPVKSTASRYSLCNVSNSSYGTITLSGNSNLQLAIKNSDGTYTQGYIYMPYMPMQSTPIFNVREWEIIMIRKDRKEKLKKLGWS